MAVANDKKRKKPEKESKKVSPAKKRKLETGVKQKTEKGKVRANAIKKSTKALPLKKSPLKKTPLKKITATKVKKIALKNTSKSTKTAKKVTQVKSSAKKIANGKAVKKTDSAKKVKKPLVKPANKGKSATKNKTVDKIKKVKSVEKGKKATQGKVANKSKKTPSTKSKASPLKKLTKKTMSPIKAKSGKLSVKPGKITKTVSKKTKAQTTASKAKLKALKNLTKPKAKVTAKVKIVNKKKIAEKKSKPTSPKKQTESKKSKPVKRVKPQEKKEIVKKMKIVETSTTNKGKRKLDTATEAENNETHRKRRIITPNKKYADFETDTSPKRISELRAYLQDKKKDPPMSSPEKTTASVKTATPKAAPLKKSQPEVIKVIKASDMKPAEKLLKKLQKKLEKEAKAASVLKPKQNKEKVTAKITKVVTYNKANIPKFDRPLIPKPKSAAVPKTKSATTQKAKSAATLKTKSAAAPKAKSGAKQNASKPSKATPKVAQSPEKAKVRKVKELKKEDRPIQAKLILRKNIKQADDPNESCWVTGIDVFPSGEIILVDMAQKKIKLFSKTFECLSQVKLDTIPQDISISPVDASSAYFTKPFSKEGIQKVSMSDGQLKLKESFWTNGTNRGIKCTRAGILTSVQDGRYHDLDINCFKMDLLDYEGNVLQSVSKDLNGSRLFKLPLYFDVSNNGKQMIVSDCIRHNSYIISIDMSGKIKFKFTGVNNNLITPRGLTVDDENNVYVTEWEHHNVYVLSPTGKRLQLLIHHSELVQEGLDGLSKPYQLCYKKTEEGGQLIVSQEACNSIKVFKLLKNQQPEKENPKAAVVDTEAGVEKSNDTTEKETHAEGVKEEAAAPPATEDAEMPVLTEEARTETTALVTTAPETSDVKPMVEETISSVET